jgi:hypothetical protein
MKLSDLDNEAKAVILWATFMTKHPDDKTLAKLKERVEGFHEKHAAEELENLYSMLEYEFKQMDLRIARRKKK